MCLYKTILTFARLHVLIYDYMCMDMCCYILSYLFSFIKIDLFVLNLINELNTFVFVIMFIIILTTFFFVVYKGVQYYLYIETWLTQPTVASVQVRA